MKNKITKYIFVFSAIIMALFSFKLNASASTLNVETDVATAEIHSFADYGGFLGDDEDDPEQPIYYVNWVIEIIKYAAIMCLLGFSIADFFKAIVSNDKDALKKAGSTTLKRFIYCVIIFFLPIIIDFLLDLFQLTETDSVSRIGVIR